MPYIITASNERIDYFDPNEYQDTENKLQTLKQFSATLSTRYPNHSNLKQSIKMLEALMYIKVNMDGLIAYAAGHQDDLNIYFAGTDRLRDKSNHVLRCHNHISFHLIPHTEQASDEERESVKEENIFKLNQLILEIENTYYFLIARPDSINEMHCFLGKINPAMTGCLDQRFSLALLYIVHLKEGITLKLDDLVQQSLRTAKDDYSLPEDKTYLSILFILFSLNDYLDTKVTWSLDGHEAPFSLSLKKIQKYTMDILGYTDDDWITCAATILTHPHQFPGRHGLTQFRFFPNQAWIATAYRNFASMLLPPHEINEMKRGAIRQTRDDSYSIQFSLNQRRYLDHAKNAKEFDPTLLKLIGHCQGASSNFEKILSVIPEITKHKFTLVKLDGVTQLLTIEAIQEFTISKKIFSREDWQQLGLELRKFPNRESYHGDREYFFPVEQENRVIRIHQLALFYLPYEQSIQLQYHQPRQMKLQGIKGDQSGYITVMRLVLTKQQATFLDAIDSPTERSQPDAPLSANPHTLFPNQQAPMNIDKVPAAAAPAAHSN